MGNYKRPKLRSVSGSSVGKKRKKIVGCDHCNFSHAHADKVEIDGSLRKYKLGDTCPRCKNTTVRVFDSKAEFTYASELKILESVGEVSDIEYQVKYDLHAPDFETGNPVKVCSYIADFVYFQNDPETGLSDIVICDVKGGDNNKVVITPEAKLKIEWLEKEYGVPVTIIGR